MYTESDIKKEFLENVKNHKLIIKKNDGLYRHLRFQDPDSYNMYFEIITWPGYLVITGDMGEYLFNRLDDMFLFFEREKLSINSSYWAEKCKSGKIKEWSHDDFRQAIKSHFDYYFEDSELHQDEIKEIWQDVEENVLSCSGEIESVAALWDYNNKDYDISDAYEFGDFNRFTYHFLWCLYAIVWGVYQFKQEVKQ